MLNFFKYFIYIIILLSLLISYFIFTPLGKSNLYALIGSQLSKKTDVHIEVKSIDIKNYPQIHVVMNLERKAKLTLWGDLDNTHIDMNYTLTSDCIATEHCEIDDDIRIKGQIKGPFRRMFIEGHGTALDGNVSYSGIKYLEKVEDVAIEMRDVNSSKLFKLLGQTAFVKGKANANINFSFMDEHHKKGHITYDVKDKNFKGIPLDLHTKVTIIDEQHTFMIDLTSPHFTLNVSKGHYNQDKKRADAFYILDIQDLSKLESVLDYKYKGSFYAMGEIVYDNHFDVTGLSKSFGGMTEFHFKKDKLKINLENVLLEEILHLFPFPPLLTARATGDIYCDLTKKTLTANTKLNNAKFIHTKLVNVIHKKSKVNLLKETFHNSSLNLTYHNNIIIGDLKLANNRSHIYLKNTKINTHKNTINAYFDFQMQKQAFSGKVFGPLDNPTVNLDMQKLIRYQMDKQVDKMIGKKSRQIMETMPMSGVAKGVATDFGASFMNVFF